MILTKVSCVSVNETETLRRTRCRTCAPHNAVCQRTRFTQPGKGCRGTRPIYMQTPSDATMSKECNCYSASDSNLRKSMFSFYPTSVVRFRYAITMKTCKLKFTPQTCLRAVTIVTRWIRPLKTTLMVRQGTLLL